MATQVLYDAYLTVTNAAASPVARDLSARVRSITIDQSMAMQDDTAMGDTFTSSAVGLQSWSVTVEFLQDYIADANNAVDATLSGLLAIGKTTALVIRPTSAAKGSTNPEWTGTAVLESYNPVSGSVGDEAMASATFSSAGALSRGV
jgi:hypothetical protein